MTRDLFLPGAGVGGPGRKAAARRGHFDVTAPHVLFQNRDVVFRAPVEAAHLLLGLFCGEAGERRATQSGGICRSPVAGAP